VVMKVMGETYYPWTPAACSSYSRVSFICQQGESDSSVINKSSSNLSKTSGWHVGLKHSPNLASSLVGFLKS